MHIDFTGTHAVVTGGADGIGFALAQALTRRGVAVAVLDIREDAAKDAARRLGGKAIGIGCDVSDRLSVQAACDEVIGLFGTVQHLWVNAGVGAGGRVSRLSARNADWIYGVNLHGALHSVQVFLPHIEAANGARHIGFTASSVILGHIPDGPQGAYAASKWALAGVAEAVCGEARALGIGATILCPGLINTSIWDGGRARPPRLGGVVRAPEAAGQMWRDKGMPADWVGEEAIKAAERNQLYCCPVGPENVAAFEARLQSVRSGFVVCRTP